MDLLRAPLALVAASFAMLVVAAFADARGASRTAVYVATASACAWLVARMWVVRAIRRRATPA